MDSGLHTFQKINLEYLKLPKNQAFHPNSENVDLGNSIRGIEDK